ncbi:diguanylate cyclase/phosphodiesterase [Sulfuricurvum kujiense DSM 16994]|uniref:Diguanylate cyclase/phosphodiesterase n=1 Tax=Sulfuricurvum kujiense (strain ATCC BAA-921 / DSM 16994 / JCM 11577 / YK-1) TaxID=709032 RepID=E4U2E1_SULKY|nr:EAL domain-containing protein [Sulfuricurvum kujiense]ADR33591.1 diguanylate cyclase/phosphodiesterase [Sulfuricurvum kujiense DSM 16994]
MNKIKVRATLFSIALVVLLITIFILTIIQDKKHVLDEKTSAHRALLRNSFDLAMLDTQKGLSELACQIAGNREIVDAFAARDREKLYQLTLPYFNEAKHRGEVDMSGFIGADGAHFLRMQEPKKYGDNILNKRPVLAYAINNRKIVSTLDVTIYDVSVITIVPIFKNKTFIGIIQTVAKINRVQKRLDAHSGIKSAIAFDTKKLKILLPKSNNITYQGYSIVSSNDPLFDHLPKTFTFNKSSRYSVDSRDYVIASRPLTNYKNDVIAMMTCAFDVTEDVTEYKTEIRNLLIISLLSLAVVAAILHYGFRILIRRIERDTQITKELNLKLEHQLHTDHLTSLPNRNALIRDIRTNRFYALMLLNIDNFKEINDFYGHAIGDETLLALAQSVLEAIADFPMQLYKMPSDEYAIALREPMSTFELEAARLKIVNHLQSQYYDLQGASIYVTLTMGMDIARSRKSNVIDLLANADMALKSAKKRRLSYQLYDETMQIRQEYQNNILWSKKLKEAIEQKQFCLYYQPIFDALSREIVEYEALIRMIDNNGEIVSPGYFLPAARQSRLYPHLTRFVIDEVFKMIETTPQTYSMNLSVDDIFDTKEFIIQKLGESSYPERIIFELLESEGIENYPEVSTFISDVKKFGCRIAIDDFGTGYSNFAHIIKLDVDLLKIDGSLIRNIDTDSNAQTILTAITEFSKHLGLKTVAEFVHSEAVYHKCKELGIDYLQGYYLGEPKPL